MLLVFPHFVIPTMRLCPLGRSVLRLNTECYFAHPMPTEQPGRTALPRLCRAAAAHPCCSPRQGPSPHCRSRTQQSQGTGDRRGTSPSSASADDSSNPSRDWISSAPRGGSSWGFHHCFLHETPHFSWPKYFHWNMEVDFQRPASFSPEKQGVS